MDTEGVWYKPGALVVVNPETADFGFAQHLTHQRERIMERFGGKVGVVIASKWHDPAYTSTEVAFGEETLMGTPQDFRYATADEVATDRASHFTTA